MNGFERLIELESARREHKSEVMKRKKMKKTGWELNKIMILQNYAIQKGENNLRFE